MKSMFWLAVLVFAVAAAWIVTRIRRTIKERERAEEARAANLLAGLVGTARPPGAAPAVPVPMPSTADPVSRPRSTAAIDELAQQKLLFESAHKAGEAGEPALAIQLYGRLLARYPATAFADQALAAVEALKKKLVKA